MFLTGIHNVHPTELYVFHEVQLLRAGDVVSTTHCSAFGDIHRHNDFMEVL